MVEGIIQVMVIWITGPNEGKLWSNLLHDSHIPILFKAKADFLAVALSKD